MDFLGNKNKKTVILNFFNQLNKDTRGNEVYECKKCLEEEKTCKISRKPNSGWEMLRHHLVYVFYKVLYNNIIYYYRIIT